MHSPAWVAGVFTYKGFSPLLSGRPEQEGASEVILPKTLRPAREVRVSGLRGQRGEESALGLQSF